MVADLHSTVAGGICGAPMGHRRRPLGNDPPNMALEAIKPNRDDDRRSAEPQPAVTACPICGGGMEVVYARNNQNVSVCTDCHSGLTVPGSAWEIVRIKREAKWMPKP